MGTFGETVSSLVDVYAKCLVLLKLSGRKTELGSEAKGSSDSAPELQNALRKSRNKVRRAYSSRLSDGGQSFERGDGKYTCAEGTQTSRVLNHRDSRFEELLKAHHSEADSNSVQAAKLFFEGCSPKPWYRLCVTGVVMRIIAVGCPANYDRPVQPHLDEQHEHTFQGLKTLETDTPGWEKIERTSSSKSQP